ncbi:unnamed protein product [Moneuplotes crassus]|uniref:RING-type domain-containing protein n=1 Tax=Euplotes crassus TaxID=5936 RepID=A0AAD2D1Z6_EUPCR|nr:unnamed protein product [Moneuplotes crassus]
MEIDKEQIQSNEDNYNCPVCFTVMAEPVATPCDHHFCYICIAQTLERNNFACPMCREGFAEDYIPDIDKDLQKEVSEKMPEEFAQVTQLLKENNLYRGSLKSIKFFFGNRHKEVPEAGYDEVGHEWICFVESADPEVTNKFITKIEFKLHPTFHPSKVVVNKLPFQITRIGWGEFEVKIIITWRAWMKKKQTRYNHMLSFEGDGEKKAFIVDIPIDKYEKAMT